MKNETTRTKNLSGFSSRAIALVLCFVMLLTAIGSGSVLSAIAADFEGNGAAVLVDAAKAGADVDAPAIGEAEESSDILEPEDIDDGFVLTKKGDAYIADTGRDADVAETGSPNYISYGYKADGNRTTLSSNKVSGASITFTSENSQDYYFVSASDDGNYYSSVYSNAYPGYSYSGYTINAGGNANNNHSFNDGKINWVECYNATVSGIKLQVVSGTSVTVTYNNGVYEVTATSGGGGSGDSGGSSSQASGMGTEVSDANLLKILNKTDAMFYVYSYNSNTGWGLTKNDASNYKSITHIGSTDYGYIQTAVTNLGSENYQYISNKVNNNNDNWKGNQNSNIVATTDDNDVPIVAGKCFDGRGNTSNDKAATTATTTLNRSTLNFGDSLSFTTTANAAKSSKDEDLKYQYYVNSGTKYYKLDIADVAASTTAKTNSVNLFNFPAGNYKLITLGTDEKINYILDEDDFTVTDISGTPTIDKQDTDLIVNTTMSPSYIYQWGTGMNATHHSASSKLFATYNSRKLYVLDSTASPGVILRTTNSTSNWDDSTKLTNDIGTGSSGITDNNYYKKIDTKNSNTVDWDSFSHISTELTINSSTDAYSMGTGDTVTITNTPSGTLAKSDTSGLSSDQAKYIYYVVGPDGTPTKINSSFSTSATYDFTPTTPGTYKVFSYVQDMWGYETAISDNVLTINVFPAYKVTVKSNNGRLGTGTATPSIAYAGQTVTINVSENMGQFSSISVKDASGTDITTTEETAGSEYTFTMPSSAATVNLTFGEMTGTSDFFYNGYNSNGSPLENYYGQQMSLGKVGGQEYSYYHVLDRSGTDQLFTVSYGTPKYNSWDAFFDINKDWEQGKGIKAQFYATDGNNLGDYANMSYVKEENSKKKFKIAIPDGARKVQFKHGENTTGILNLYEGNNGWYTNTSLTDLVAYDSGYNPVPVNFYENFNGEGKYTSNFSTNGFYGHNATRGASHAYTKPKDLGTDSGDYYIIVLYEDKTYTINGETHTVDKDPEIIWMPKLPGTEDIDSSEVNVYGKDGPIVIDWNNKAASGATGTSGTAYGYSLIADTKLYDSDGTTAIGTDVDDDGASYEKAKVVVTSEDSANIVIKTTINSSYTSKYYLKGWNINGVTYACGTNVKGVNSESAGSNGVYTMTYTIPAGTEDSSSIEITPIYYLLSSYKTSKGITTVKFYLEGYNTITEKWGDTPYIYPFYGNLNNVDNSFGVYPGQPMVFAAGQYSVEVPVNKNVPIAKEPGDTVVKGITINNGYADHVHRNLVYKWSDHDNDQEHKQTYDYDDFYKIYEECLKNGSEHPNSIIFRIQDEETVFNRSQYGGGKSGQFAAGTSNISISDIATSGNGWELLVNRYDNAVNIFGSHTGISNPGSGVTATNDTDNALYVVSTGYNANIAGDYGTMWKIYNGSGVLISNAGGRVGVPPSVLLLRGDADGYSTDITYPSADRSVDGVGSYTDSINDYAAIYKALHNSDYTNKRVYITYEKDAQDTRKVTSGTGANRLDGRWFYTHSSDKVQSKIGIEYWDNARNKWVTDSISGITGSHTTCTAKFTDSNATTSNQYLISSGNTYNFTAEAKTGWKFDSWQIKYSETSYDPIGTTETASVPATACYEIVARFVPTTAGDLTINHTLNKASSGEGDVTMAVNVYTDSSLTTKVTGFTEKTGSRVYLDGNYINNDTAINYVIQVQLKTTPIYDGKVSQFTYDKFNTDNSITATTSPAVLPGSENGLTTSTFTIPVSSLYNVSTLKTRELNYTSLIDETLHYYNFTYNFTDRSGVSKTYTSKGVMGKTEYAKIVSDQANHKLDSSILVDKAPFESNFLKSNTLTKGTISYASETHTYTATSSFSQSDNVPTYHVVFKLPYSYYNGSGTSDGGIMYKKYTASSTAYNASAGTFDLAAKYNTFVTVNATSTVPDTAQTNVDKVTDGSDINHTGNNFITAPDELIEGSTTMYFKYWDIKKLKSDGTAGDDVAKIYYPDFHYRVYSDYYVTAVYSDDATDSWKLNYSEENNTDIDCSVLYLGDSRNQWNSANKESSTDAADAADLIYSDFIFHYTYMGKEIKDSTDNNLEVGMILERATYKDTSDGNTVKWLTGSTSVNDMSYYRANYGGGDDKSTEADRKSAIKTALDAGTALPSGTIKAAWAKSQLNNKNFTEQSYKAYSQYGQTVANDTITFAQDSVIDNYVYRAYAYIKDATTGKYTLSDPVYFSMRYTSNLKYTE